MKYLDVTYVKISNFKVAVAVSQTCEEHSICLYMNLQTLALKQFCIYNKPNNKNMRGQFAFFCVKDKHKVTM